MVLCEAEDRSGMSAAAIAQKDPDRLFNEKEAYRGRRGRLLTVTLIRVSSSQKSGPVPMADSESLGGSLAEDIGYRPAGALLSDEVEDAEDGVAEEVVTYAVGTRLPLLSSADVEKLVFEYCNLSDQRDSITQLSGFKQIVKDDVLQEVRFELIAESARVAHLLGLRIAGHKLMTADKEEWRIRTVCTLSPGEQSKYEEGRTDDTDIVMPVMGAPVQKTLRGRGAAKNYLDEDTMRYEDLDHAEDEEDVEPLIICRQCWSVADIEFGHRARGKSEYSSIGVWAQSETCLLYTSPSPRDLSTTRMPSSA